MGAWPGWTPGHPSASPCPKQRRAPGQVPEAYQGPTLKKAKVEKGKIKITFAHTDGGLVAKGDKLGEFSIAGADRKWHWADAKIEGNSVVVSSPDLAKPVAARYAWQSNPLATLYNGAGLPAVPFRTDDWPEITQNARPY